MLRIVIYTEHHAQSHLLRTQVAGVVKAIGPYSHDFRLADSAAEAIACAKRYRAGRVDLLVCQLGEDPGDAFDALRAIHGIAPSIAIVVVAENPDDAIRAYRAGASGFAQAKDGPDGLLQALRPLVTGIMERRRSVIGLRSDAGVGNVVTEDIIFAEASRKGSVIHLANGSTLLVRLPLRDLLAKLATKGDFLAAGSSLLVNLDNACKVGGGAAIFSNGESIVVPVRVRKPLKDAFDAFLFSSADAS